MTTAIADQLKVLVELQKLDSDIFQMKKELAEHPALEKKAEADFEQKKSSLKAAEAEMKSIQLKQKEKEGELAQREEKVKKLQSQLYQLKTNKEYSAMDLEIKSTKADNSLVEDEILKLFDAVEGSKKKVAEEKEKLSVEEKKFTATKDELKKRASELQAKLAELEKGRAAIAPGADPKLLSQYERILKGREGLALVPVRKGSCGGCHIDLPPQALNEVQMQDRLVFCEECARILYWPS